MPTRLPLDQQLPLLGSLADAMPDPVVLLDRRNVVQHRNPPAAREFPAISMGQVLTLSLRHPALIGAIDATRRLATAQSIELHQTVPTETWHRVTVAPLAGLDGVLLVSLQNLSEQRRAEQLRSDFIANASHELRTPLASLIGFIDTLLGPAAKDEAARERFLGIMRQQAGRMSALIDDLLSLSRIEMRQHVRPTGQVRLATLLAEVRDGLQTQAADAGVTVSLTVPEAPVTVTGDAGELYEVFENLLDNAIKYGGDGKRVDIVLGPGRLGYDHAVTVTDYGAGIAPEHVPRLTERFYRVDAESSRKKKGTGLGLAIVKHTLNRHRAQLAIRSTPGEGTRVEVLINS